jgi:hypothetical protein
VHDQSWCGAVLAPRLTGVRVLVVGFDADPVEGQVADRPERVGTPLCRRPSVADREQFLPVL